MGIQLQAPQITINGKKYTMPKPKIKLWRHLIRFRNGEFTEEQAFDEMINLVVLAFKNPDVTFEAVEENMDFNDLKMVFAHISQQVTGVAGAKMAQIPNGGTPTGI